MVGELKPAAVVDAILAKAQSGHHARHGSRRHRGRGRALPRRSIAMPWSRPCAGILGRVITQGSPQPNTGVPGMIGGYGKERVIQSAAGVFRSDRAIGDIVSAGDVIGYAGDTPMCTQIDGLPARAFGERCAGD